MAPVPPLPHDSTLAARGVDFVVRKPAASTSQLPARTSAHGTPLQPQAGTARSTVDPAAVLAPELTRLLATIDLVAGGSKAEVDWPLAPGRTPEQAVAQTPEQALAQLRQALADSPLFAVRRLTERWFPAAAAQVDAQASQDEHGTTPGDASMRDRAADARLDAGREDDASAAARAASAPDRPLTPADRPAPRDLAQAAALLIGGRLQWQGELTPGVRARIVRDDHWHPEREGDGSALQAGTRITLVVDLPHLGPVTLQAVDTPGRASIDLFAEPMAAARLEAELGRLQDRMRRLPGGAAVSIRAHEPGRHR